MKKIILSILSIVITFAAIGQNIQGYYVTGWNKLEAKRAFVIDLDTFYATTQLSGFDTILVSKQYYRIVPEATKEPTGFEHPENVVVNYNSSNRTVTLTGNTTAFWRGDTITALVSGWTSTAHTATTGAWYLYYNGSAFVWSQDAWSFDMVQICFVNYNQFAIREPHGLMPYQTHKEFHETIGTYLSGGGDMSDYTLNSTTSADRRPLVSSTTLIDEDNKSVEPALSSESYTRLYLSGTNTSNFVTASSDILPLSGNQPYINLFSGGAWTQSLMSVGDFAAVWLVAMPVTADAQSQVYRYLWVQPQSESGTLSTIQALAPSSVSLGNLTNLTPEVVFVGKIIIRYIGGNWQLISVEKIIGNKVNQQAIVGGSYLSSVATDLTLLGNGTTSDPLKVDTTKIATSYDLAAGLTTKEPANANIQQHITNDLDLSASNEIQTLTRVSDSLKLTSSTGVDLSDFAKDADLANYAPASGSGNYIQNQNASAQTANMWISGESKANTFQSTVATGTAPLTVASTTLVSNFTANYLGGPMFGAPDLNTLSSYGRLSYRPILAASTNAFPMTNNANAVITLDTYDGTAPFQAQLGFNYSGDIYNRIGTGSWTKLYHSGNSNLSTVDWTARNFYATDGYGYNTGNFQMGAITNNRFYIYNGVTSRDNLTIYPTTGNVGIYSTSDNGIDKLQVNGTASGTQDATLSSQFVRLGQLPTIANVITNSGTSTDNAIARFDGTTGKIIQNSGVVIDDNGRLAKGVISPLYNIDIVDNGAVSINGDGIRFGTSERDAVGYFYPYKIEPYFTGSDWNMNFYVPNFNYTAIQESGRFNKILTLTGVDKYAVFTGKTTAPQFQMTTGAGIGKIPVSDASGNLSFNSVNEAIGGNALSTNYIPYWDGSKLVNSVVQTDGTIFGFGNAPVAGYRIFATGNIRGLGAIEGYNATFNGVGSSAQAIASFGKIGFSNGFQVKYDGVGSMNYEMHDGNLKISNLAGSSTRLVTASSDGTLGNIANAAGYLYNDGSGNYSYSAIDLSNYYTKTNLQTSGQASVHWDNITNEPTFQTGTESYISNLSLSGNTLTSTGVGSAFNSTVGNIANITSSNVFTDNQTIAASSPILYIKDNLAGSGQAGLFIQNSSTTTKANFNYSSTGDKLFISAETGTIGMYANSLEALNILSTGQVKLPQYTGTTFDGTITKYLGVDANGNIVKATGPSVDLSNYVTLNSAQDITGRKTFKTTVDVYNTGGYGGSLWVDSNGLLNIYGSNVTTGGLNLTVTSYPGVKILLDYQGVKIPNLPTKGSETEVLYVNSTTGKLAKGTISTGVTDHSALSNLSYATAGHTDFVSTNTNQDITGLKTFRNTTGYVGSQITGASSSGGFLIYDNTNTLSAEYGYNNSSDEIYIWGNYATPFKIGISAAERLRIKTTGQLQLNNYKSSSAFTGTAVAALQVDASGNVITGAVSGGITGSGVTGRIAYWGGTSSLTSSSTLYMNGTTLNADDITTGTLDALSVISVEYQIPEQSSTPATITDTGILWANYTSNNGISRALYKGDDAIIYDLTGLTERGIVSSTTTLTITNSYKNIVCNTGVTSVRFPANQIEGKIFTIVNRTALNVSLFSNDGTTQVVYSPISGANISYIPATTSVTLQYISGGWYRLNN